MKRHENCESMRQQLLDCLAPGAAPSGPLAEHLRECPACAAEAESLRRTWALLEEWKAPEPAPYFDSRLQARLREEKSHPQPSGILSWLGVRWQPALAAALALALAITIGIVRMNSGGTPPVDAQSAAVTDLQDLDKNADVYNNFDLLYDNDDGPAAQQQPQNQ